MYFWLHTCGEKVSLGLNFVSPVATNIDFVVIIILVIDQDPRKWFNSTKVTSARQFVNFVPAQIPVPVSYILFYQK